MLLKYFVCNDSEPTSFHVRDTTPLGNATKMYSIVADYGWCERIICSQCYLQDANDLVILLGILLKLPASQIEVKT